MMPRTSSIVIPKGAGKPVNETREGWPLTLRMEPVDPEPDASLADISHRPKALLHAEALNPFDDLKPGESLWTGKGYLSCRTLQEAVLFDLKGTICPEWGDLGYTDMTEAWVLLALWGEASLSVMQRLVEVDIERPDLDKPFYLSTRNHAINIQIINLKRSQPGFLLSCTRSHGQNLFNGLIHAGEHLGLRLAGLEEFEGWFDSPTGG